MGRFTSLLQANGLALHIELNKNHAYVQRQFQYSLPDQ